MCVASFANGATITWKNSPAAGSFSVAANWDPAAVPGGDITDIAKINNQTGGTLTLGTLKFGLVGSGASKSPEYRISGGTLNISSIWSFGDGTDIKFLASGGTVNYTRANADSTSYIGTNDVTQEVTLTNNAVINYSSASPVAIGGGGTSGNSKGRLSLSGTSSFNAPTLPTVFMGNNANRGVSITLADSTAFSAPFATVALGQWINGVNDIPAEAAGTVTVTGSSLFKAAMLKTGGANAANTQWGVINFTGGTIEAGSIQIGASTTPADVDRNVIHVNGGTIRSMAHVSNNNFFQGAYVDIHAGGMTFDSNGVPEFIVADPLRGIGRLTKIGSGTLTLSAVNTYSGATSISAGELKLNSPSLANNSALTLSGTGKVNLVHGGIDGVGSLTFGATAGVSGTTYGSTASGADVKNDTYFAGTGMIVVGSVPNSNRTLTWTGAVDNTWSVNGANNFVDATSQPTNFKTGETVIFNNTTGAVQTVTVNNVQPKAVTIQGTAGWVFQGANAGITGAANITSSAPTVSLGGPFSTFTGSVNVSAGSLTLTSPKSLGQMRSSIWTSPVPTIS